MVQPRAKKRFIAGAVCPACGELDKIVMFQQDGKEVRECVRCGFSDVLHWKPSVREPETRVNVTIEQKQAQTQPIRLVDDDAKPS